jgi:hypothetical protein
VGQTIRARGRAWLPQDRAVHEGCGAKRLLLTWQSTDIVFIPHDGLSLVEEDHTSNGQNPYSSRALHRARQAKHDGVNVL